MAACRVKICGVRDGQAVRAAAEAGAAAIGFVFAPRSVRHVPPERAAELASVAPAFVSIVGLFTETPVAEVRQITSAVPLDLVQLHGERYEAEAIAELSPLRVVRAVSFEAKTAAEELGRWEERYRELTNLAGLIVDTPDPTQVGGGTGRPFDWTALRQVLDALKPTVPLVLAGGLTPQNIGRAIATVQPWAVDVSSGVESERGVKDPQRIRRFCQAVQAAEDNR